jgi:hypothetical protein
MSFAACIHEHSLVYRAWRSNIRSTGGWRSRPELIVDKIRQLQPESAWKRILDMSAVMRYFDWLAEFGEAEGLMDPELLLRKGGPYRR